jgi:hypothetical protein
MRLVSNLKTKLLVVGEREVKEGFIIEEADILLQRRERWLFQGTIKIRV